MKCDGGGCTDTTSWFNALLYSTRSHFVWKSLASRIVQRRHWGQQGQWGVESSISDVFPSIPDRLSRLPTMQNLTTVAQSSPKGGRGIPIDKSVCLHPGHLYLIEGTFTDVASTTSRLRRIAHPICDALGFICQIELPAGRKSFRTIRYSYMISSLPTSSHSPR
jgi:hypothetical protein